MGSRQRLLGQRTDWGTPEQLQGASPAHHPGPVPLGFLLAWLTSAASGAPVQLVQSGVGLAEGAEVVSQRGLGQGRLVLVLWWPRPGPRDSLTLTASAGITPLGGLACCLCTGFLEARVSSGQGGRDASLWYAAREGGSCREPNLLGALPHTKPGPGMDIPVAGGAQCPQPEGQDKTPKDPEGRRG